MVSKEIIVVAEHRGGALLPVSLETAQFGLGLAKSFGGKVTGLALGPPNNPAAEEFSEQTGLDVLSLESDELKSYCSQTYLFAIQKIISERPPSFVLVPHTATGWDYAPALAIRAGANCSTGITEFVEGKPPAFKRQICGGKLVTEVSHESEKPTILTVMPGAIKHVAADSPGNVERTRVQTGPEKVVPLGHISPPIGGLDLNKAEVIISAGRGVNEDQLGLIHDLANCFDKGAVGSSRPLVDSGLLPMERQVGQTGQTVSPRLYMACGISGALQHTVGMSNSELIVAVNTDPNSLIWNTAHFGVQMDISEFLPILIEKIKSR